MSMSPMCLSTIYLKKSLMNSYELAGRSLFVGGGKKNTL